MSSKYSTLKTDQIGKDTTWGGSVSVDNIRTYPRTTNNGKIR